MKLIPPKFVEKVAWEVEIKLLVRICLSALSFMYFICTNWLSLPAYSFCLSRLCSTLCNPVQKDCLATIKSRFSQSCSDWVVYLTWFPQKSGWSYLCVLSENNHYELPCKEVSTHSENSIKFYKFSAKDYIIITIFIWLL